MNHLMVCVTRQKTCQRLIDYGTSLKTSEEDQLYVIHVARENEHFLGNTKEGEALEFLYEKAKEAGAVLTVVKSADVIDTLSELAQKNQMDFVVAGESGEKEAAQGFLAKLKKHLPGRAELVIVPAVS